MAHVAQVLGNGRPVAPAPPSRVELKRRRRAIEGSKVGILLATLHGQLADNRRAIRDGKLGMGLTPQEFDRVLSEIQEVLVLVRDAYVDERCPSEA